MNAESKATAVHLKRAAYLYIRQSTLRQVLENTESHLSVPCYFVGARPRLLPHRAKMPINAHIC